MVNNRKGNYAAKSSEEVHEAPMSKSAMHGLRMRGRRFKKVGTGSAAKDAENAPSASETHISDMDSDDLDNVPLARLLKKSVFVPTPSLHHASNVEPSPSHHSSPVRSSVPDNVSHVEPALAPIDESITTEGRTDIHADEIPANDEDNVEPVNTVTHDNEILVNENVELDVHNDSRHEIQPIPEERISDEANFSDKHHSCLSVMSLIEKMVHTRGLKFKISLVVINDFLGNNVAPDCSPSIPSNEVLASILSRGT
ncbi:envelope-like protein [Cucumis melo var. makuwa]|uniref:Envelope-like protein n=1 Tax=Cucumis melo var. makuwa TaxID=1194695 RepID=A0A5A7VEK0_CUCMM|nr:envelope-like protein [Cucumis melo var. makuwa]